MVRRNIQRGHVQVLPEHNRVAALIYWRDPKKSGIVFGTILGVLLSLAYFSLISVLAYMSLLALSGTIIFRIYKTVLQAVQKTSDGHPFKDILDLDLTLPAEKVHEVADVAVAHANAAVSELRRLFLVEDFVDSLKFGVLLWCLTYVGSWFNGMTLIIIGVVALFTLPKVYETNQEQIDQNLALVQTKISEITTKIEKSGEYEMSKLYSAYYAYYTTHWIAISNETPVCIVACEKAELLLDIAHPMCSRHNV
ncbi:Reticulon-1 [Acromyrmex echinatior]|uniref:Reticulon-like protein n=1 Tax=Acromyrmex echinatior TaxID=103372 RepID=F4WNR2_ACREC|nr:Reticulon-1 [Acromyrmex echinatior]